MIDVSVTIVALKSSVRKHNKLHTVCISQKRASLVSDMRKKGVTFPRDPKKQNRPKPVAAPKQKKTHTHIVPTQVVSQYGDVAVCKMA